MKYFIDTEFIEGFHKPVFGKRRHHIDLISIGIVCEDGRTYSAISSEYDYKDASEWVQKNVIIPLYINTVSGDPRNHYHAKYFHRAYGLSLKQIATDLLTFFGCWSAQSSWQVDNDAPEIYGYYADYDWVVLCSIFGTMMDLPKGFPMYCRDLKQMLDESYIYQKDKYFEEPRLVSWLRFVKNHPLYPKQTNEHEALADARWNRDLYEFIAQRKFNVQTMIVPTGTNPTNA